MAAISSSQPLVLTKETRIGVLCGGLSEERAVSQRSGKNCHEALLRLGYVNAMRIDVGRDVAQVLCDKNIELAFLALHGKYGEDGAIQGLLEFLDIPYTGNRLAASAVAMDKDLTKRLLSEAGLPVLPSETFHLKGERQCAIPVIRYNNTYPVMVKPISEGSSVGMSKVDAPEGLEEAIKEAMTFTDVVMVEQYVPGKSITVGMIDIDSVPTVMPILELRTKTEWYDQEAKYTEGLTEFIVPAELSDKLTAEIQEVTRQAHKVLGCHGVSRTDYVVDAEGRFFILEVNTIPGMTDLSDLPAQAKVMGIEYDALVALLLKTALS